jgi:hypothetical protein
MNLNDTRADEIIKRQAQLAGTRGTWESHWRECAERVRPFLSDFYGAAHTPGEKRNERIFDSTAVLGLERFGAVMDSLITPQSQRWSVLTIKGDLGESLTRESKVVLEDINNRLFRARYSPRANFANQNSENMMSLGLFGTAPLFIDEIPGTGIRYRALHLSEVYIGLDHVGRTDTVHRKYSLTARQAAQKFGEDNLPEKIRECLNKDPDKEFAFIHCVKPNEERKPGRKDYRGMRFASYDVSCEGRAIVREGGYRTMPYAVARYTTAPNEVYGRSPAMSVLASINMVNEMQKTILRAGQKNVDPPLLLTEDGILGGMNTRSSALNHGGLSANGVPLVQPLQTGANIPLGLELSDRERNIIEDSFLVTLFRSLIENPNMTATQALLIAREQGALLGPVAGRLQSEYLGTMIEREIDLLSASGALPELTDELREMGGYLEIEFTAPINQMQKAADGLAIQRTLEAITPIANIDPSVLEEFDLRETARVLASSNGMPAKCLKSDDRRAEEAEEKQAMQDAQMLLEAAPVLTSSMKNMAQAQAAAASVPSNIRATAGGPI